MICSGTRVVLTRYASVAPILTPLRLFFSSRRLHTKADRDWSSDVCSSDLFRLRPGIFGLENVRSQSFSLSQSQTGLSLLFPRLPGRSKRCVKAFPSKRPAAERNGGL